MHRSPQFFSSTFSLHVLNDGISFVFINFTYIFQVMALTQENPISDVTKSCQNAYISNNQKDVWTCSKKHVLMVYISYIHAY